MKLYFLAKRHVEIYGSCSACGNGANKRRKMARILVRNDEKVIVASLQVCCPCLLQGAEMSVGS